MPPLSFGIGVPILVGFTCVKHKKTTPEGAAKGGVRVLVGLDLCSFAIGAGTGINVLVAHDVIFAQVGTSLHFD